MSRIARLSLFCIFFSTMAIARSLAAAPPAGEPGLVATLTDGKHKVVTVVVAAPNFALKPNESIDPHLEPAFTAQWAGVLKVVKREPYRIGLDGATDADARLTIDGKAVGAEPVELDVGEHAIEVRYVRKPNAPARQQLIWSAEDFLPEPVPESALAHHGTPPEVSAGADAEAGRLLVESFNCVACHHTASRDVNGRKAPDLTTAGTRLKPAWVAQWLADPQAFRHGALMPQVPLSADDRRDVTAYLATLKDSNNRVKEEANKPASHVENGRNLYETVGCTACHAKIGPQADKADAKGVAINGLGSKWLTGQLGAFIENPLAVDHSGRMPSMLLSREDARDVAEYLTESRDERFEKSAEKGNADRGREVVKAAGCVQCHVIEAPQGKPVVADHVTEVAPLEKLEEGKGCLAEAPAGKAMRYALTPQQRKLIVAFVRSINEMPLVSAAPTYAFYHKVATLGCTNCHALDQSKPADSTERIPQLTNVGARLRKEWIHQVLTQRTRVRTWLHRRMPEFGPNNVADVQDLAVAVAGVGDPESLPVPSREETLAGQKLLGSGAGGFGCITCHGYNGAKPAVIEDTRGPDITTVAARLRPDHFRRWVYDPKRVAPDTPMPSFFDGVPAREAAKTIETIYRYCAAGTNMPPPVGFVDTNNYTLAVREQPVVMRAFLPNLAGGPPIPRGIAVGLPELVSYAFDADRCAVAYAWTGGFLDMQPSWAGRGGNQVKVMGRKFYGSGPAAFPLRIGDSEEQPKPQFAGYAMVDGPTHKLPQFVYRVGNVEVRETVAATEKDLGLVFTFELDSGGQPVTFVTRDEADVTVSATGGELQPTPVRLDSSKPETVAGHALKLPGGKVKFSVTVTAKEGK